MNCIFVRIIALIFLILAGISPAEAREITDMTGRTVVIPENIDRVFAVSPPGTYLVYAIDPTPLIGLNFPLLENEKSYTVKSFHTLPVIGGLVGQGRNMNQEVLLLSAPDVIVIWMAPDIAVNKYYEDIFTRLKIPWVNVRVDTLDDYPQALLFMGDLLARKNRAAQLYRYAVQSLQQIKTTVKEIPAHERPRIYYAEGMDGFSTERAGSLHADLIEFCGGINVHRGKCFDNYTMEKISPEQVILYDPDIILIKEKAFYDKISTDPRWKNIQAVRQGKYYLIPHTPFNWFDRPSSFMRLIGAKWLSSIIYPERFRIDMVRETKSFYRLFLGVTLNDREAIEVLGQ